MEVRFQLEPCIKGFHRVRPVLYLAESRSARDASRFDVHKGFETALFGDVSTAPNGAVFFSGKQPSGIANFDLATDYAIKHGAKTLNLTPAGQRLDALNLYPRLAIDSNGIINKRYASETSRLWEIASRRFAQGASGNVNAFVRGAREDGIYLQIERQILLENPNVNLIER